jgi:serine protease Do
VRLGRLEDGDKPTPATARQGTQPPESKPVVKRALGLDLANLTDELRKKYKVKDSLKGVIVTKVEAGSAAAERRLAEGTVILEIEREQVATAADVEARVDQLKKAGKQTALLLVASPDGDTQFVAVPLQ